MNNFIVVFYLVFPGGKYKRVTPNLETGEFEETEFVIEGGRLVPYGFVIRISGNSISYGEVSLTERSKERIEEVRIQTFKSFVENVSKEMEQMKLEMVHVLIGNIVNTDNSQNWLLEADCQTLMPTRKY